MSNATITVLTSASKRTDSNGDLLVEVYSTSEVFVGDKLLSKSEPTLRSTFRCKDEADQDRLCNILNRID